MKTNTQIIEEIKEILIKSNIVLSNKQIKRVSLEVCLNRLKDNPDIFKRSGLNEL